MLRLLCFMHYGISVFGSQPRELIESWSIGKASWKGARDSRIWDQPNACDPNVLRRSAPLTVLFGLSSVWNKIQETRQHHGRHGQPLEVHVLGASYPFEGRSDWSLLAQHRPADVSHVRIRLVLGTPFQSDNVPPMDGQPNSLLELSSNTHPLEGKWSKKRQEVVCKGAGKWGTADMDKDWSKEKLCKDYGDGLEVVCIEKFYQDVRDELPHPDLVVMFSPGFPQLGRRSWDAVLIGLLNDGVPTMISDIVFDYKMKLPTPRGNSTKIHPGGKWDPSLQLGEDWQTWLAMRKYGAHMVKSRRGPFPILHKEDGEMMGKNAVVQIYLGYKPNKKPTQRLTSKKVENYNKLFEAVDWNFIASHKCNLSPSHLKGIFKLPTSKPFDNAVRDMHFEDLRRVALHHQHSLDQAQRAALERYGLLGSASKPGKRRHWGLRAWVLILRTLGCRDLNI